MGSFDWKAHPQRAWQGHVQTSGSDQLARFDPQCYLCPEQARAGGAWNPQSTGTFVFENDFAALKPDTPPGAFRLRPARFWWDYGGSADELLQDQMFLESS